MKLTMKKLEKLVEEVLVEISTGASQGSTGDAQYKYDQAVTALAQHKENEPKPKADTETKEVLDTTQWIHPDSSIKTTLGKAETQPDVGWQDVPGPKVKGGSTTYGSGTERDHAGKPAAGYIRSTAKKTTNPTTKKTTTTTRPAWTTWDNATSDYEQAVSDAESNLQTQKDKAEGDTELTASEKTALKTGASMGRSRPGKFGKKATGGKGAALKGGGFGRTSTAKGVGKKRGQGKKKDESLFRILGRDLIKEFKDIKKYSK